MHDIQDLSFEKLQEYASIYIKEVVPKKTKHYKSRDIFHPQYNPEGTKRCETTGLTNCEKAKRYYYKKHDIFDEKLNPQGKGKKQRDMKTSLTQSEMVRRHYFKKNDIFHPNYNPDGKLEKTYKRSV